MAKRKSTKSAQQELDNLMTPATDKEPQPRKRVAKKKVTPKKKVTSKKAPAKGKGTPKKKKETEAQKERRERKEAETKFTMSQKELQDKFIGGATEKFNGTPEPGHFKWRPRKKKNVWDGSPGMYISPDPCQKFKDFPVDYLTDPVTKLAEPVKIKRLKKAVPGLRPEEDLFRIDRRQYIKKTKEALLKLDLEVAAQRKKYDKVMAILEDLLPVEYFAVAGEPKIVCAVSFGEDGKSPVDRK